ncbi:phage tail tape measure protein [Paramuribaculum intestinale]|uniref:phage tail tape measure protein n=1 Tax=Paramuribaculum intestinale TaxID=2094151 RepID=UPI002730C7E5|nr:phage tail tape measure protein [Paramuribaculum intestinale]
MADNVTTKILQIQVDYGDAVKQIAEWQSKIDAVRKQQKSLKDDLKEGRISQEEYQRSIQAGNLAMSQMKDAMNTVSKAVKNQLKSQAEQEGSLVQLRAEISNLNAEYDRLSRAERESAKGDELKDKINRLTTELKSAEEGTQRFYRNVGNYKSALLGAGVSTQSLCDALSKEAKSAEEAEKANEILKRAVAAIDPSSVGASESIALLTKKIEENDKVIKEHADNVAAAQKKQAEQSEGLIDTMSNLTGVNLNFGNSLSSLSKNSAGSVLQGLNVKAKALWATLTGLLANPVVLTFLGIAGAGMAFKWWYDYNKGLVEATRRTQEFTGLAGDELKAFRNEVQGVADSFGVDFMEVLKSANAMSQQFGISVQEAMQYIKDGFVSGANITGQFTDMLKEYPAYFKEAGISASQFVSIIAQSSKMGIVSDKAVDTIKEANIRLREMSTATTEALDGIGISSVEMQKKLQDGSMSTFDAMQQVSAKLNEISDNSPAVAAAISDIFGGPGEDAGLQYLRTLKDIELDLDTTKSKAGELAKIQEEQMNSQIELDNTLAAMFDATGGTFEKMTATAKIWVNNGIVAMIKGCAELVNWFIDLYNNSMVVRAGVASIAIQFKTAWSIIKNVCILLVDEIIGLGKILKGTLTLNWDDVKAGWDQFRKASSKAVKNIVSDTVDAYKEAWSEVKDGQLEHVNLDISSSLSTNNDNGGQTGDGSTNKKPGKTKTKDKKTGKDPAVEAAKEEAQLLRKAEDELLKITIESIETRRKRVELSYQRQIEDYEKKLAEDKNLTEKSREAILSIIDSLQKQQIQALAQFNAEEIKKEIEHKEKLNQLKLEAIKKGTDEEFDLRRQSLANQQSLAEQEAILAYDNETEKQEALKAIREKYANENTALDEEQTQVKLDRQKAELENEIAALEYAQSERELRQMRGYQMDEEQYQAWRQRGLDEMDEHQAELLTKQEEATAAELEALMQRGQLSTQTTEEFEAEILAAKERSAEAQKRTNDTIIKNEQAKAQALKDITGGLTKLLDTLGESNEAFAKMSKIITLAQISIDTGKALSAGIASASSNPFPANLAAIATTVATILANIATAISTVKSAKFAQGGKVTGPGTGTSDSIPAMLSNGEFVMTAAATKMFEPLLMTMNNIGRGVPMQVLNSSQSINNAEMLTDSFESAAREIKPIVSVVEITEAQDRVEMIENLDTY